MQTFLHHVATSLLNKYGSNLSHLTVVFPGKRASLFLNQALAEISSTPVWAPRYQTIAELFEHASRYSLCDPIEAICRLHRSYARFVPEPQSLDLFYSWGEILMADFDDVDKHLVPAQQLFANISEIRALDDNSYITPEQEAALKAFFSNFSLQQNTELKERFLRLWNHMGEIYSDFRTRLQQDGLLYEGALQRDVVEQLQAARRSGDPAADAFPREQTFVFVGFNVLNNVEEALFDELQARHQALFYWDYDRFYTTSRHEAGHFIRHNLQRYGNELPDSCFDNLSQRKELTFITAATENAQARYVPSWLRENLTPQENQTAVVLCNEQLLQPVLHALPTDGTPEAVNITMGYGLTDTPVYSFINALITLQTDGYDALRQRFRTSLLRTVSSHPFARLIEQQQWLRPAGEGSALLDYLMDIIHSLAPHFTEDSHLPLAPIYRQLYTEALFQTFTTLSRLRDLMQGTDPLLDVSDQTLRRVLRNVLSSQTIPFHGEPATGLQIMGVLETRVLDFQHLLLLSTGEGFLPKAVADTSLIPYSLKEAFGLTTIRHKIAVYAYYFYHLIQRAERVTFVYNESNAGSRQNEPSRFLRQILAETDFPIRFFRLTADSEPILSEPPVIEKDETVMQQMRKLFDNTGRPADQRRLLSPSALNTYTACPLRFYYRYVRGLRIDPDPSDGLDPILFGNVFHRAAELIYKQLTSRTNIVHASDIDPLIEKDGVRLQPVVRQAFRECFFMDRPEEYTGILIIAERVMQTYLLQLLRHDRRHCPIRILGLEQRHTFTLHVGGMELETGGIIDRLDQVADDDVPGGTAIRVIDYKTGGYPNSVAQMQQLFSHASQKEEYYLQSILYATILATEQSLPVTPCLFFVHKSNAEDYSPLLQLQRQTIHDVRSIQEEFMEQLTALIEEILNPAIPFTPIDDPKGCEHCHFRALCGR